MSGQTEIESKASKFIETALTETISMQPHLGAQVKEVTITPFRFGNDMPEVIAVTMPEELLRNARLEYSKMHRALKKQFSNSLVLTRRAVEIPKKKSHNPNRVRESVLNDLLFPAVVAGRATRVESRGDMEQMVYLDPKNQCWSESELRTIEKVLEEVFSEKFCIGIFGAGQ